MQKFQMKIYKLNVIYLITAEKCLFKEMVAGLLNNLMKLSIELGKKIIKDVGQQKINELNKLEDDFDYSSKK